MERGWEAGSGSERMEVEEETLSSWLCIMSILLWRNERNYSRLLTVKELEMVSMGLRSLLTVEKSVFGLLLPECMTGVVRGACTIEGIFVLLLVQFVGIIVDGETRFIGKSFKLEAL